MTPWEAAVARAQAYKLFGEVIGRGIQPKHIEMLATTEDIREGLQRFRKDEGGGIDLDKLAVDHHTLFGMNVPPFAGIFLTDEMHTGGADYYRTPALRAVLLRGGDAAGREVESLSTQLLVLSELCTVEATCLENRQAKAVSTIERDQFMLLHVGIFSYFPAFFLALHFLGHPVYAPLARLLWALTVSHIEELGAGSCVWEDVWKDMPRLDAEGPPPLTDENTGLRDILRYILTPHRSGWFLMRRDIQKLAHALDIPVAPVSRREALETLFYGAIDRGCTSELLARLGGIAHKWLKQLTRLEQEADACVARTLIPWRTKVQTLNVFMDDFSTTTRDHLSAAVGVGV